MVRNTFLKQQRKKGNEKERKRGKPGMKTIPGARLSLNELVPWGLKVYFLMFRKAKMQGTGGTSASQRRGHSKAGGREEAEAEVDGETQDAGGTSATQRRGHSKAGGRGRMQKLK
jgi:hypothetical protein